MSGFFRVTRKPLKDVKEDEPEPAKHGRQQIAAAVFGVKPRVVKKEPDADDEEEEEEEGAESDGAVDEEGAESGEEEEGDSEEDDDADKASQKGSLPPKEKRARMQNVAGDEDNRVRCTSCLRCPSSDSMDLLRDTSLE